MFSFLVSFILPLSKHESSQSPWTSCYLRQLFSGARILLVVFLGRIGAEYLHSQARGIPLVGKHYVPGSKRAARVRVVLNVQDGCAYQRVVTCAWWGIDMHPAVWPIIAPRIQSISRLQVRIPYRRQSGRVHVGDLVGRGRENPKLVDR